MQSKPRCSKAEPWLSDLPLNDIYNDLGFTVRDISIILLEAQSSWTVNVLIRILMYMARSYQDYIHDNELDVYSSTKIHLPKPEIYVLFTGKRADRPETLTLSGDFFGEETDLEITAHMLYGDPEGTDIISQYVAFTKIYDQQRTIYGRSKTAIEKTIQICQDKNILAEYLKSREKELSNMMFDVFDDETIIRLHEASIKREAQESIRREAQESIDKANEAARKAQAEAQKAQSAKDEAISALENTFIEVCKDFGACRDDTVHKFMIKFAKSQEYSEKKVDQYWDSAGNVAEK